jgi:hypothetical protein
MTLRRLSMLLALALGGCSLGTETLGNISLQIEMETGTVPLDRSIQISLTARNVGNDVLTLSGPGGCLLYFEVLNQTGTLVYHSNNNCSNTNVTETIDIGQQKVQTFSWNGTSSSGTRLASGFYFIRGVARTTGVGYVGPVLSISIE